MQIVADYSSLVSGVVSKSVKGGEVIIPMGVLALLESEMNLKKIDGFVGSKELIALKTLAEDGKIELRFTGEKPRFVSKENADWEAREISKMETATIFTCSEVQDRIARSLGLSVMFFKQDQAAELSIAKFFDKTTMSIHIKEGLEIFAKKGQPGKWDFVKVTEKVFTREIVEDFAQEIVEKAERNSNAFIEIDKEGATVVQYENYRIVITRHPFSKGSEITAVRPVKILTLDDYKLDPTLMERFEERAEGIVIAGAPGAGKTTFAQALAEFYSAKKKIVKTIEHPRDLSVSKMITQYGHLEGDPAATGEVLLLVRPDFTVYDELRGTTDFEVYSDMRLAGVGMIGVVHASRAIDAIQRFLGRLEMGVIPQVLDTVIYLVGGQVSKVFELEMLVKVPSGMTDADLARPIVEVRDFFTKKAEFEIYTYGEETAIVPVRESAASNPLAKLAEEEIKHYFQKNVTKSNVVVKVTGERNAIIYVDAEAIPRVIGKQGSNITGVEKKLGMKFDIQDLADLPKTEAFGGQEVNYDLDENKNAIVFYFEKSFCGRQVDFRLGEEYLFSAVVSKKGKVKIGKKTDVGKKMAQALHKGQEIKVLL